eukprot:1729461-Rhodomonas_salina.1
MSFTRSKILDTLSCVNCVSPATESPRREHWQGGQLVCCGGGGNSRVGARTLLAELVEGLFEVCSDRVGELNVYT